MIFARSCISTCCCSIRYQVAQQVTLAQGLRGLWQWATSKKFDDVQNPLLTLLASILDLRMKAGMIAEDAINIAIEDVDAQQQQDQIKQQEPEKQQT
jgi:hypothetical protein